MKKNAKVKTIYYEALPNNTFSDRSAVEVRLLKVEWFHVQTMYLLRCGVKKNGAWIVDTGELITGSESDVIRDAIKKFDELKQQYFEVYDFA
jgi:hypothetical protein